MSASSPKPFFVSDLLKRPAIENVNMVGRWQQLGLCHRPMTAEIRAIIRAASREPADSDAVDIPILNQPLVPVDFSIKKFL